LKETRRRAEDFEEELAQIKAETAKKKIELLRYGSLGYPQKYSFGLSPNVLSELNPTEISNRMAESHTYFRQPA